MSDFCPKWRKMRFDEALEEAIEKAEAEFADDKQSEAAEEPEARENAKEKPEEYNGVDYFCWTTYEPTGEEKHYRTKL